MRSVYRDDSCRRGLSEHLAGVSAGNYSISRSSQIEHGTRTGPQAFARVKRENGPRACPQDPAGNSIPRCSFVATNKIVRVASQKQRCPARHPKEVNERRGGCQLEPREGRERWADEGGAKDYASNPCWVFAGKRERERSGKRPAQNVEFPRVHDCRLHYLQQVRVTVGARGWIRDHDWLNPARKSIKQWPEEDLRAVKAGQQYQRCSCQLLL